MEQVGTVGWLQIRNDDVGGLALHKQNGLHRSNGLARYAAGT